MPFTFRMRNRLIAGCSKAVLIVEAGLPSGTFTTADEALAANKDVLVVPSAITSPTSKGANRLLYQGATPVVDDETFDDVMFGLFSTLRQEEGRPQLGADEKDPLLRALLAEPLRLDQIVERVDTPRTCNNPNSWAATRLAELEAEGVVARYPDGRYGPSRL
ncbi:MAG: DNA-processing protein DprA [Eggerthellaceae bacterium]|nr:DNA-processing protein DprA [Eggerthellaceae bacterium]